MASFSNGSILKVKFKDFGTTDSDTPLWSFDGYIGIAEGDVTADYATITNDYSWFTNKITSDYSTLGMYGFIPQNYLFYPSSTNYLPQAVPLERLDYRPVYRKWRLEFSEDCYFEGIPNTSHWPQSVRIVFNGLSSEFRWDLSGDGMLTLPFPDSASTIYYGSRIGTVFGKALVFPHIVDGQIPYDDLRVGTYIVDADVRSTSFNATGHVYTRTMSDFEWQFWNYCLNNFSLGTDPYAPGGIAEPGGGDGTFDWESDIVPVQPLPEISITDAGFVNLYVPTKAQLQNLCRYLWSSAFDIDSLKRIFLEPMDVIIGLSILPITPEEVEAEMGTILVGQYSSGISSYVARRQYVQVDCGTVTIEPKWGAYLDFSPYSKLQMYLPYIGFVDITPDDCMNGTIHVVYNLDILSGSCLAQIECTTPGKDGELNSHVLYEYTGNCAVECPVTSGQYRNIISSIFNIASGVAETAASGNPAPVITSVVDTIKGITKPMVSRAGGPGKNTGILGHQAPFLVLTCPRMIIPGQQNAMIGYPSYVTLNLGDLNGYTQIDTIHLSGVPASKDEQDEIVDLLQKGVFL